MWRRFLDEISLSIEGTGRGLFLHIDHEIRNHNNPGDYLNLTGFTNFCELCDNFPL